MNVVRRLAELATILSFVMAWWLVNHVPTKWFFAGVAISASVAVVVVEWRAKSPGTVKDKALDDAQRPLAYEEVMAEDARELLRINRERQEDVNRFYSENARKKAGLDK